MTTTMKIRTATLIAALALAGAAHAQDNRFLYESGPSGLPPAVAPFPYDERRYEPVPQPRYDPMPLARPVDRVPSSVDRDFSYFSDGPRRSTIPGSMDGER